MAQSGLPATVTRHLEEAGASAYAWYEEELERYLDPRGSWRLLSTVTSTGWGLVLLGSILTAAAFAHGATGILLVLLALAAGVVVGYGGLFRQALRGVSGHAASTVGHLRLIPWWSWALMGYAVAYPLLNTDPAPLSVLALIALVLMAQTRSKAPIAAFVATTISLVSLVLPEDEVGGWVAHGVVVIATAIGLYLSGVRSLPRPLRAIQGSDLKTFVPPPPSGLPWLLRSRKNVNQKIDKAPGEIKRKAAGAVGERRMGLVLLLLRRWRGTRILHDVMIPGAREANIDHVVLARSGVFVIDTKEFGSKKDPGVVTYDLNTRQVVHRTRSRTRSIESSVKTALWAQEALSRTLGVTPTPILAVFNAEVASNLKVQRNGRQVEVISAWNIVDRIDNAPRTLSAGPMSGVRTRFRRLRSAVNRIGAQVIKPRGASQEARTVLAERVQGSDAGTAEPPPAPKPRHAPQPRSQPRPEPSGGSRPRPKARSAATKTQEPAAATLSAEERVDDRWQQMAHSEPAPPDDTPEEFRTLGRGDEVLIIDVSTAEMTTKPAVAMSPACRGVSGTYIWYCSPEQYQIHQSTGRAVNVATISTTKIARMGP